MMQNKPRPVITDFNAPYWEGTQSGQLRLQRCSECGRHWLPPSGICPHCLADSWEWDVATGRAQVWSWIRMHQVYFEEFRQDAPYVVALIELEEGPMLISTVVDVDANELACGLPVQVCFAEDDPVRRPMFRLRGDRE